MDIDKLEVFVENLNQLEESADKAFEIFKEKWSGFASDERKILNGIIAGICLRISERTDLPMKTKLYWLAIVNYAQKPVIDGKVVEDSDEDIFPGLSLRADVKGNQITKIFHDLKANGTIISSYDLIAEAISIIFPIIEQSTAYKDLTESKRLSKVISLLP